MPDNKAWVSVTQYLDGITSGGASQKKVESVNVIRNAISGKNEVIVKVNGEVIFQYDANFKDEYMSENDIQKPLKY